MNKMISVKLGEVCWRLVLYYLVDDVMCSQLLLLFEDLGLCGCLPRVGLCERLHNCEEV